MSITLLPTPPSRQDPNNFAVRADAFLGALPTFGTEANSLATAVNTNAVNAAASATAAATSATNAATSATNAAASFDSFDDRYLGPKTANPTLDNDNATLLVGALYWNTTAGEMRVWNGTAWVAVQTTTAATNAATSATAAATSATAAGTSATNAAASATAAAGSATAAGTSASNANSSAMAAANSFNSLDNRYLGVKGLVEPTVSNNEQPLLTGALYWNSTAGEMRVWNGTAWVAVQTTTAATNAAASATAAATSATNAATSATNAAASFDSFDDRYLGTKTANPTLDNDNATLLVGALYWNSTAGEMRVWNGTAWVAVQTTTAATNAAASASAAARSADLATLAEQAIVLMQDDVTTKASAAATSATNAAASFDSFDDRYLGTKTANPTLDNDNATLLVGALYWNSTAGEMRVWNGTAWVAVQTTTAATNAAASATAAATSATAAAGSAINSSASFNNFDARYLGPKVTNPTLNNSGNALSTGALYWNSITDTMRVWTGTAWVAVQTTSAATDAAASATAAAGSANAAAGSAILANASANAAALTLDSFDDRYLGAKSSNPTLDNDSQFLATGALYWNTTANEMRAYNGTTWLSIHTPVTATSTRIVTPNWIIEQVGNDILFKFGTVTLLKLGSDGSITTAGNITAFGTP